MNKFATRVMTLAMFSMAVTAAPLFTKAYAAGSDTPSPPASSTKDKKKGDKSSSIEDPKFHLDENLAVPMAAGAASAVGTGVKNVFEGAGEAIKELFGGGSASQPGPFFTRSPRRWGPIPVA